MENKGFTLVELIGVITLLAVIVLISVPIVNTSIKNTKEKAYKGQVNTIIGGAKKWVVLNGPKNDTSFNITIQELINEALIEDDKIIDPRDDSNMITNGACVFVNYSSASKSYIYTFSDDCVN